MEMINDFTLNYLRDIGLIDNDKHEFVISFEDGREFKLTKLLVEFLQEYSKRNAIFSLDEIIEEQQKTGDTFDTNPNPLDSFFNGFRKEEIIEMSRDIFIKLLERISEYPNVNIMVEESVKIAEIYNKYTSDYLYRK